MRKIRITVGSIAIDVALIDTPTADAVLAALPIHSSALTWGEEVYFSTSVKVDREAGARAVVEVGEIAFWPDGDRFTYDTRHWIMSTASRRQLGTLGDCF